LFKKEEMETTFSSSVVESFAKIDPKAEGKVLPIESTKSDREVEDRSFMSGVL